MKPPKSDRPRLALVRWRDCAAHDGGWQTVSEVATTSSERVITSVGWVLPWGTLRGHVSIAQDYDAHTATFNGVSHVPFRGCVVSWRFID